MNTEEAQNEIPACSEADFLQLNTTKSQRKIQRDDSIKNFVNVIETAEPSLQSSETKQHNQI